MSSRAIYTRKRVVFLVVFFALREELTFVMRAPFRFPSAADRAYRPPSHNTCALCFFGLFHVAPIIFSTCFLWTRARFLGNEVMR